MNVVMAFMWVPRPTPPGTFDQAIRLNRAWPEAQTRLAQQQGHILIWPFEGHRSHQEALRQATLLTLIAAALADVMGAIGVYWLTGGTITERSSFVGRAKQMAAAAIWPTDAWVNVRWFGSASSETGKPLLGAVTKGLQPFVGRELEFAPAALPPHAIGLRVIGLAHYLLSNGPVLQDGHTVGISENERIRIRAFDERHWPSVPFWVMNVEALSVAAPPPAIH